MTSVLVAVSAPPATNPEIDSCCIVRDCDDCFDLTVVVVAVDVVAAVVVMVDCSSVSGSTTVRPSLADAAIGVIAIVVRTMTAAHVRMDRERFGVLIFREVPNQDLRSSLLLLSLFRCLCDWVVWNRVVDGFERDGVQEQVPIVSFYLESDQENLLVLRSGGETRRAPTSIDVHVDRVTDRVVASVNESPW